MASHALIDLLRFTPRCTEVEAAIAESAMETMVERSALLNRYRRLRGVMRNLHSRVMGSITKEATENCGDRLGFRINDTLVFDSEDDVSILMDYCIYDWWEGQKNAITRCLSTQSYGKGSDERLMLEAMSQARYSLFQVQSVAPDLGVNCLDLLRGDGGSIIDEGMGSTSSKGIVFAARLVVLPELSMTSGAGFPVDVAGLKRIRKAVDALGIADYSRLTNEAQAELSATIIRHASAMRSSPNAGMAQFRQITRPNAGSSGEGEPSRNRPCPCGSGKLYKRCCARH